MVSSAQMLDEREEETSEGEVESPKKSAKVAKPTQVLDRGDTSLHITASAMVFSALVDKLMMVAGKGNSSNPVLGYALVEAGQDFGVVMVASDLDRSIIARSDNVTVHAEGSALLPIKDLVNISNLCGEVIDINITDGVAKLTTEDAFWTLNTIRTSYFNEVPQISDNARGLPAASLQKAMETVVPAIGKDESRPNLMMISFDTDGLYTTDGGRSHFGSLPSDFEGTHIPFSAVKPLMALLKTAQDAEVFIEETESHIIFLIGQDQFAARLLDAQFPSVRGSIIDPRRATHQDEFTIARDRFILGLRRAAAVSDEGSGSVTLKINDNVCMCLAQNGRGDRVATRIECVYTGQPRQVQYLVSSLSDMLQVVTDEMITLKLHTSPNDGSILYHSATQTIVVMSRVRS